MKRTLENLVYAVPRPDKTSQTNSLRYRSGGFFSFSGCPDSQTENCWHLKNHYGKLLTALELEPQTAISRAQLPRVLEKVSVAVFDRWLFANYGLHLNGAERQWFVVDGKELRGSIEPGAKRSGGASHRARNGPDPEPNLLFRRPGK